ncbi:NAD-glutamate dehydrogenase, partial [Mycobacterium sp. LTG2003]
MTDILDTFAHTAVPAAHVLQAYASSCRGPRGDAPSSVAASTGLVDESASEHAISKSAAAAHYRLAQIRRCGETQVAVYTDNSTGVGPALQIVTDSTPTLVDSVTVLLHRLGVGYRAIMSPVFQVRRGPNGELIEVRPSTSAPPFDSIDETWIHVQLTSAADAPASAEAAQLLPDIVADARQIDADTQALLSRIRGLADDLDHDGSNRFPSANRTEVADLLRWLADGNFRLLGYQCCTVDSGKTLPYRSSRLGVLRLRTDASPQLTEPDGLLAFAQATIPSYVRYGAYPYVVAVREQRGGIAVEHRFVGVFTAAAMGANVLGIPVISRRVREALASAGDDVGHPNQLLLDIVQTIPRSELFALNAAELLDMVMEVVDLGARRRTLLFLRADEIAHFVSCLVYLPRDRYTTAVRLEMQDILVRELGGTSIEYAARVSESPWAVAYFTVRLPDGLQVADIDLSVDRTTHIQDLLTDAARTWSDRLLGYVRQDALDHGAAQHYAGAFPEDYKQAVAPIDAINDIAILEALTEGSVKLVLADSGEDGIAQLTWYLGGQSASLSELLPMLQSMGVVVLEERPFTVARADGLPVWIYQFKISRHRSIPAASDAATAERFADAVTAIWHGRVEIDRFNELVLRAGLT